MNTAEATRTRVNDLPRLARTVPARKVVRWYLMFFPFGKKGLTVGLNQELARRRNSGETPFEYFAPTYVETKEVDGKWVTTQESLLYNYFFIHASEDDLFILKRHQPQYSVLRRVINSDGTSYFPYVKDNVIKMLQWIARSYGGCIPLCLVDQTLLVKGDRIRVIKGAFKGIEANLVKSPKSAVSQIMVFVDNWMCVPLMNIRPNQYEVIGLNDMSDKPRNTHGLDNQQLFSDIHDALCRFHQGTSTEDDRRLATDICNRYADLKVDTSILRCKLYSLLLPAYTILGSSDSRDAVLQLMRVMLPTVTAEQSLALLTVTLYGCTDNVFYHDKAHAMIAPWLKEDSPKKSKLFLIHRLADYDRCLGH